MLEADFRSERLVLDPGDRLLLYTDGVSEAATDAGEEFGAPRLEALMEAQKDDESLPERYAEIMKQVTTHASGKFRDDATLLLIAINDGSEAPASYAATPMRNSA